jgi:hypothetical protein
VPIFFGIVLAWSIQKVTIFIVALLILRGHPWI